MKWQSRGEAGTKIGIFGIKVRYSGRNCYICNPESFFMKHISSVFYGMQSHCTHFIGIPVFLFLFTLLYHPFGMDEFLAVGGHYTLNLILMTVIVLGVLSLSRMLMFILRRVLDFNWATYILWCVMEVVFSGMFLSILLGIGWSGQIPYLTVMTRCIGYLAAIMVYPYAIINLTIQLVVVGRQAASAPQVDDKTLIRFYDDAKRIKLIVSSKAILYIEAEENYVHILHVDNDKVKDFCLRSSMRALEDNLSRHGLVRCHRSYFINPEHVELVKKDPAGYAVAQLRRSGLPSIPVSKRYYEALTKLL